MTVRRALVCLLSVTLAVLGLTATAFPAAADARGPITPGTATTVTLAVGAEATYSFTAVAGRHLTLAVQSSSPVTAQFAGPAGAGPNLDVGGFIGPFADSAPITSGGTWTVTFRSWNPEQAVSAQVTLGLVADLTGAITPGTQLTQTFTTGGQDARLTFQGTAGRRIAIRIPTRNLTLPQGSPYGATVNVLLTRPGSTTAEYIGSTSGMPAYIEVPELTASGTYTLTLDPAYGSTGTVTLGLYQPTDVTGTLTPGTARTVTFATPGQRATLTFAGVVGARATFRTSSTGELSGAGPQFTLRRPDGSTAELVTGRGFQEGPLIDQAGTWSLSAGPSVVGSTGTVTVTLGLPTDVQRAVTPGTATQLALPNAGQNARLTFQAQQGQKVTLRVASPTWTWTGADGPEPGTVRYSVRNAAGEAFSLEPSGSVTAVSPPLPAGGQWYVGVDPVGDTTGSATLTVGIGRARTAALTVGQPATAQLAAGDTLEYTFAGAAGRRLNFSVTAAAWSQGGTNSGSVQFTLIAPDGSEQLQRFVGGAPFYAETTEPLPASGTWRLRLDPSGDTAGSQTIVVRQPADVTGAITSGASRTVTLGTPGQRASYTFPGAVGQRVVVDVTSQSWRSAVNGGAPGSGAVTLSFVRPDGEVLGQPVSLGYGAPALGESLPLDVAGTWTAIVDPEADAFGSLTATPRLVRDTDGGTLASGASKTVDLPATGQRIRYSFAAKAGDSVGMEVTRAAWTSATRSPADVVATLRPPAGSSAQAKEIWISNPQTFPVWLRPDFVPAVIEEAGTWTLEIDPEYDTVGSQTFALHVRTPVTGELRAGQARRITLSQKGQDALFTLPTQAGVEYRYAITGSTFADAVFGRPYYGDWLQERIPIPPGASSGTLGTGDGETWPLRFDPTGPATGALTITITAVPAAG